MPRPPHSQPCPRESAYLRKAFDLPLPQPKSVPRPRFRSSRRPCASRRAQKITMPSCEHRRIHFTMGKMHASLHWQQGKQSPQTSDHGAYASHTRVDKAHAQSNTCTGTHLQPCPLCRQAHLLPSCLALAASFFFRPLLVLLDFLHKTADAARSDSHTINTRTGACRGSAVLQRPYLLPVQQLLVLLANGGNLGLEPRHFRGRALETLWENEALMLA